MVDAFFVFSKFKTMNRQAKITFMVCLLMLMGKVSAQTLVLHHANGTTTDVDLYTMPQVKFQDDKVFITSTVLEMEYPKTDVLRFTYKGRSSGISEAKTKANVSQKNGLLVFNGIKASDKIAVYTVKGILVPVHIHRSGTSATLPLSAIPSGAYLLSVNGRTSKFMKR